MKSKGFRASLILLAAALILFIASFASAESVRSPLAMDVVIVIEHSHHMNHKLKNSDTKKLDVDGLRFDAAAALISMCDADYSRAGYFLFNKDLYIYHKTNSGNRIQVRDSADIPLYDISLPANRTKRVELMNELNNDTTRNGYGTEAGCDIGQALNAAVEIQMRDLNNGNRKIILLLTAGNPRLSDASAQLARQAAATARENGIEIYAVELMEKSSSVLLQDVVTNRDYYQFVTKAEDLVDVYRNIFAFMIGSDLTPPIESKPKGDGTSEIQLRIPNNSVAEVNIILPLAKVSDPELADPDGNVIAETENNILVSRSKNFVIYKLIRPKSATYTLSFTSKDRDELAIQYVFSYDNSLKSKVTVNGQETDTAYKSDTLKVESYFFDNREGRASTDTDLYTDRSGETGFEEWMGIKASWELYQLGENGEPVSQTPVRSGDMEPNSVLRIYSAEIDLKEEGSLPSGKYRLVCAAKGAGMDRRTETTITLLNHDPAASNVNKTIYVNRVTDDPEKLTWTAGTADFPQPNNVYEIVTDQDGDKLEFSLDPEGPESEQAARISMEPDGTLRYTTRMDGGKVKAGTAVYRLTYTDQDPADPGEGSILITLNIKSHEGEMLEGYKPEMDINGDKPAGVPNSFRKNSSVTVSVKLKELGSSSFASGELMESLLPECGIQIIDQSTGDNIAGNRGFALNDTGDAFECVIEDTGNKAAQWDVIVTVGPFEKLQETISIPNDNVPAAVAPAEAVIYTDGEKVPGFLQAFIGMETADDDEVRKIKVGTLFTDKDEDILTYSKPAFLESGTENSLPEDAVWTDPKGAEGTLDKQPEVYTIMVSGASTAPFKYSFSGRIRITATDGDGKTGVFEQTVVVVDLYNKMVTYAIILAIAIVILIILILIIHQIRKPVFPKLNMTIREEPSLYDSSSEQLSPVKTATNLNAIGVDSDMAAKHNISMELLQSIIVKPIRSKISVGVCCKKAIGGHDVSLEDVRMKPRKQYTWKIGQELTVRNMNGEGCVTVKLEDRSMDENPDPMRGFGENDDWASADSGQGSPVGKKHSRKVDRKAAPAPEETGGDSSDGFDF